MRSLAPSLLIHALLVALVLLLVRSQNPTEEIPIELTEFLKAKPQSSSQPLLKRPAPATQKTTGSSAQSGPMGKSPQASTQSTTGSSDSNEPLSEEYEVSELPVLIHEVRSPYPPAARARKIQGAVILDLVVRSSGEVGSVKVVQSPAPELSEAAMKAVREFKFRPARLKDKPVAIQIRYTYRFILE